MSTCCNDGKSAETAIDTSSAPESPALITFTGIFKMMVPVTVFVLIPKCPACIAGYVLVFTGIGLSLPVASIIRWMLLVLCIAAFLYLLGGYMRRVLVYRSRS